MHLLLGSVYWLLIVALLMLLVDKICRRSPTFRQWRQVLRLAILVWCGTAVLKKAYLDSIFPPGDAIWHEAVAREIAELLRSGSFVEAFDFFGFGNPAYRFMLGVFYALTGAPELVTYTANGALGLWAMLAMLEALDKHSGCKELPALVVLPCLFLPSGLLWTTTNLKEGLAMWGICMMLQWTLPQRQKGRQVSQLVPLLGMAGLSLIRPHIAIIWLVVINLLSTWRSRKFGLFLLTSGGALVSLLLLKQAAPELFNAATGQGVASALGGRYEYLVAGSDLASHHFLHNSPTPIWTGVMLILFRPWPFEVKQMSELLAGSEVWLLAFIGIWAWSKMPNKLLQIKQPCVVSLLIGLALFGFFFSYMYNMGLVARQRLMVFPLVWMLYSWPSVVQPSKSSRRVTARQRLRNLYPIRPESDMDSGKHSGT